METITDFWCDNCKKDLLRLRAFKTTRSDQALWISTCPKCKRELIRFASNPKLDPYYKLSRKVQMEAERYAKDFIQPDHPDFDKLYPKYKKEKEAKLEEEDRKKWETKKT